MHSSISKSNEHTHVEGRMCACVHSWLVTTVCFFWKTVCISVWVFLVTMETNATVTVGNQSPDDELLRGSERECVCERMYDINRLSKHEFVLSSVWSVNEIWKIINRFSYHIRSRAIKPFFFFLPLSGDIVSRLLFKGLERCCAQISCTSHINGAFQCDPTCWAEMSSAWL